MSGRYNRSAPSVAKSSNNCFTYSLQDTLLMHARAVIFIYFSFLQKEVRLHFDLLNSLKGEREAESCKKKKEKEKGLLPQSEERIGKPVRKDWCKGIKSGGVTSCSEQSAEWWLDDCAVIHQRSIAPNPFGTGNIVAAHVATYISIKGAINLWKKDFLFTLNSSVLM